MMIMDLETEASFFWSERKEPSKLPKYFDCPFIVSLQNEDLFTLLLDLDFFVWLEMVS